jgi:hypothetical protein
VSEKATADFLTSPRPACDCGELLSHVAKRMLGNQYGRGDVEPSNKGMEQTNGALAEKQAPFAAHPQC